MGVQDRDYWKENYDKNMKLGLDYSDTVFDSNTGKCSPSSKPFKKAPPKPKLPKVSTRHKDDDLMSFGFVLTFVVVFGILINIYLFTH